MIHVYLDESGDLGFVPGATEYFTIAFLVADDSNKLRRQVKKTKERFHIPRDVELKGARTRLLIREDLLRGLAGLDIEVHAITVLKRNVEPKLRRDTNILYNYMVGLSLVQRILQEPRGSKVFVNADRRVTAITSRFNFSEYVRYKVWYDGGRVDLGLEVNHLDSHEALAIQGADIVCNSVFRKYNSDDHRLFNLIRGKVKTDKRLFFGT